jgi:squalene-hopene/tetraprenyl-beta-curcumene cyclase
MKEHPMKWSMAAVATFAACMAASLVGVRAQGGHESVPAWNSHAAAAYLDLRADWWVHWPTAARDHDTTCVSCHTAAPYALARTALHAALKEHDQAAPERQIFANVVTRVKLWKDVEPFYPDQLRGLPKSSESRGTEAILNALLLARRDAASGVLSDEGRQALNNLWPLQFKAGDMKGGWAWLNFHNEPWEANDSGYYGNTLAALAIGSAPGGYAATPELQDQIAALRDCLQRRADAETLFNRLNLLWASSKLPGILTPAQRQAIVDAAVGKQQADGGWTMTTLSAWKRQDESAPDMASDGYATGLATLALEAAGLSRSDPRVSRGLAWLASHQDPATGKWSATSLNKRRDPNSDPAKFMSDAATAYAVLALTDAR